MRISTRTTAEKAARAQRRAERATIHEQLAAMGGLGNLSRSARRVSGDRKASGTAPSGAGFKRPCEPGTSPTVSTARAPGTATQRHGDMRSPSYLEWVRRGPCALCEREGACDPHHAPSRGSLGRTVDLLVASVCRPCHNRCDASQAHGGYGKDQQGTAVAQTLTRFLRLADLELQRRVLLELLA